MSTKEPRRALAGKNRPVGTSLMTWVTFWLLLDRFQAPMWAYGVWGTLAALVTIAQIHDWVTAREIEL